MVYFGVFKHQEFTHGSYNCLICFGHSSFVMDCDCMSSNFLSKIFVASSNILRAPSLSLTGTFLCAHNLTYLFWRQNLRPTAGGRWLFPSRVGVCLPRRIYRTRERPCALKVVRGARHIQRRSVYIYI